VSIRRGEQWGHNGALPAEGVLVTSDAQAAALVDAARRDGTAVVPVGLLGGDLCTTLGGRGDEARMRTADATRVTVDVGRAVLDGGAPQHFVAHLLARRRWWRGRTVAVMNAAWLGSWNVAPRAHPGDGRLDVVDARLSFTDRRKARARLPLGTHVPHPAISMQRIAELELVFERPTPIRLDGRIAGTATHVRVEIEPEALDVVV
jgi:hypothetical protein